MVQCMPSGASCLRISSPRASTRGSTDSWFVSGVWSKHEVSIRKILALCKQLCNKPRMQIRISWVNLYKPTLRGDAMREGLLTSSRNMGNDTEDRTVVHLDISYFSKQTCSQSLDELEDLQSSAACLFGNPRASLLACVQSTTGLPFQTQVMCSRS